MPDGSTIKYSQGIQTSCILSSLASALYYMGDVNTSEYIIRRKQLSLTFIHDKGRMEFCRDTLTQKIHYQIQKCNTSTTTFDILQNHSDYPTVCLLLDMAHRKDHCITVCGKWIFDSKLESALPLTKASLNYICSGNDTDEITFVGVLNAIRAVPPVVVQKRLNI